NARPGPPVIWLGAMEKNLVSIARCPGPELRVLDRLIARSMVQVEVNVVTCLACRHWRGQVRSSRPRKYSTSEMLRPPIPWNSPSRSPVSGSYCHPARFCQDAFEVFEGPETFRRAWLGRIGRRNINVDTVVRVIEPGIAFVVEVHRVYWSKLHPIH
ncbi:hypothetical protein BN1723_012045, partial [Verticillium longisporum]